MPEGARHPFQQEPSVTETLDMLVVGAGISGIGAAWHLKTRRPDLRFAVLESKNTFGGTWVTHRFPGTRSDSDLFTFGYRFKPWRRAAIATAQEILHYLGEVIEDNALADHIRYAHRVLAAQWSSEARHWVVSVEREGGEQLIIHSRFLWMCQGYYRHERGYTPEWDGVADFKGQLVHPQTWPDDLELAGRRVVVVGSGATAATLVPAIAGQCASLTLLQRSPTWYRSGREIDVLVGTLRELDIPDEWVHEIARRKVLLEHGRFVKRCAAQPEAVAQELLAGVRAHLGPQREDDVLKHFTPCYLPWRQRVTFVPEGDLFKAVARGEAEVVTDEIECFEPDGLRLRSGAHLLPI
jgi:cation diffusion facilitator CzcD-associated flavoprotein CzcO